MSIADSAPPVKPRRAAGRRSRMLTDVEIATRELEAALQAFEAPGWFCRTARRIAALSGHAHAMATVRAWATADSSAPPT